MLKEEHVTPFEDEGPYVIQEPQDSPVCQGILDLEERGTPELLAPESYPESVCEEDVTLALKELDERCEEEEADFSGLSRCVPSSTCPGRKWCFSLSPPQTPLPSYLLTCMSLRVCL